MNSCKKGAAGERELASILRSYGYEIERGGTCSFGTAPDLAGLPGIHIECKRVEKLNINKAIDQAERDAEKFKDGAPTVFHRVNRSPWLVTMRLEDWMQLYNPAINFPWDTLDEVEQAFFAVDCIEKHLKNRKKTEKRRRN